MLFIVLRFLVERLVKVKEQKLLIKRPWQDNLITLSDDTTIQSTMLHV